MPFVGMNADVLRPMFKDPFAQESLGADVHWTGWEVIPGIFLLFVMAAAFYFFRKGRHGATETRHSRWKGFQILFAGSGVFVLLTLIFFIKRIEGYSQRAAIEFFESKTGQDCYVIPHGYRSYAHLFYTLKPKVTNEKSYDRNWLYTGDIDKDVFVVAKIHRAHEVAEIPGMEEVGRKNGFVFFRRRVGE